MLKSVWLLKINDWFNHQSTVEFPIKTEHCSKFDLLKHRAVNRLLDK